MAERLDEAAQLVRVGHLLDELLAAEHTERFEVGSGRGQRIKRVGLLPKLADSDAHGASPRFR
jgi:hypothetical protein